MSTATTGSPKKSGVKVLRFSIGFGRPLARWVRGPDRTEWVLSALPLGGYVRMLDERDPECLPIEAADLPRAFNRQSVSKRIAIVLAGPVANLLLAVAVYWFLSVVGVFEPAAVVGTPPPASCGGAGGIAGRRYRRRRGRQSGTVVERIALVAAAARSFNRADRNRSRRQ